MLQCSVFGRRALLLFHYYQYDRRELESYPWYMYFTQAK